MEIEELQFNNSIQQQMMKDYQNLPKIQVLIRKRPLNQKECGRREQDVVEVFNHKELVLKEMKTKVDLTKYLEEHEFLFDNCYDNQTSNEQLYMNNIQPLIQQVFNGAKITFFAYGQTGSGKTYTMLGDQYHVKGLYQLASLDLFRAIQSQNENIQIIVSFYEIYCGKLYDLLNERNQLQLREDSKKDVNIIGLSELEINNVQQMIETIQRGNTIRITSNNSQNNDSSRSHAILAINIRKTQINQIVKRGRTERQVQQISLGKLSFIDLAGNERASDVTDMNKQTRIDGAEINKSLLALKECIRALDQNKTHVPFRQNKLTLVLKDSFVGGNCKSVMIANISPSISCQEHTLNTLRYADRVKELRRGGLDNRKRNNNNINKRFTINTVNNVGKDQEKENILEIQQQEMPIQMYDNSYINQNYLVSNQKEQNYLVSNQKEQNRINSPRKTNKYKNVRSSLVGEQQINNYFQNQMGNECLFQSSDRSQQIEEYNQNNQQEMLNSHRQNINEIVNITRNEMELIGNIERENNCSYQDNIQYAQTLEQIIEAKMHIMQDLLQKVREFKEKNGKQFSLYEESSQMFNIIN